MTLRRLINEKQEHRYEKQICRQGKIPCRVFLAFRILPGADGGRVAGAGPNRNQVSGKVTDKAGEPLIGATVVVVGTTTGATTGADGRFTIGVPAGGELKISYIGYVEQTVKVARSRCSTSFWRKTARC